MIADPPMIAASERVLRYLAQAWAVLLLASGASAQEGGWPSRTIQMVVPYTPGTGADILARILGPKVGERWKIGVVTDNRAGASGNIGTDFVAKATPDGYTLLCTATSSARICARGFSPKVTSFTSRSSAEIFAASLSP